MDTLFVKQGFTLFSGCVCSKHCYVPVSLRSQQASRAGKCRSEGASLPQPAIAPGGLLSKRLKYCRPVVNVNIAAESPYLSHTTHRLTLSVVSSDLGYGNMSHVEDPNQFLRTGGSEPSTRETRPDYSTVIHFIKEIGPKRVDLVEILLGNVGKCQVRRCNNTACLFNRARMERAAPLADPHSEWSDLRDWALVVASCRSVYFNDSDVGDETYGSYPRTGSPARNIENARCLNSYRTTNDAAQFCTRVLEELGRCTKWLERDGIDVFGLCELLYWISASGLGGRTRSPAIQTLLQFDALDLPQVRNAVLQLPRQELCRSRIWKLAQASRRGLCSLPSLLDALGRIELPNQHARTHRGCNAETCLLSDVNATRVQQLHTCETKLCESVVFPLERLNELDNSSAAGVWYIRSHHDGSKDARSAYVMDPTPKFAEINEHTDIPYLAISHVWSDGTGAGLKESGHVNKCLFEFFSHWAMELGCEAIWWDTLCVPTDREQRHKALRRMHENYSRAKHTLVHDRELATFTWKEDGSPCLALATSTWFTRGWTALELYASDSVQVLFSDDRGRPIVKSLHKDILTKRYDGQDPFAHPAWVDVSKTIRELQTQEFYSSGSTPIATILGMLNPRSTSWIQDKILIASLIADLADKHEYENANWRFKGRPSFRIDNNQPGLFKAENTKNILKRCKYIEQGCLLHGKVTISLSGPWSWCPLSLFDLSWPKHFEHKTEIITGGDLEGHLEGTWLSKPLQNEDVPRLKPLHTHLTIMARVAEALRKRENHMLLAASGRDYPAWRDRYILVEALDDYIESHQRRTYPWAFDDSDPKIMMRKCIYVGTVTCDRDTSMLAQMSLQHFIFW